MVAGLGLWGKDWESIIIKAVEMRLDAKHITKDKDRLFSLEGEVVGDRKEHDVEKIGKDLSEENRVALDAVVHSTRLATLSLLILYGIAKYGQEFVTLLNQEAAELRAGKDEASGKFRKVLEVYGVKIEDVRKGLERGIGETLKRLRKDLKIVFGMENLTSKTKKSVALVLKESISLKARIVRYFKMRLATTGERKGYILEKKMVGEIQAIVPNLKIIDQVHGGKGVGKMRATLKRLNKQELNFVEALNKGSEKAYDLFVGDFLVMRLIYEHLNSDEDMDVEMATAHDIPLSMATMDKASKEAVLAKAHGELGTVQQEIQQVWDEFKKIKPFDKGDMGRMKSEAASRANKALARKVVRVVKGGRRKDPVHV